MDYTTICAQYLLKSKHFLNSKCINDYIEDLETYYTFKRKYAINEINEDKRCNKSYGLFDIYYTFLTKNFTSEELNILSYAVYSYGHSSYINTIIRKGIEHPFALCMDYVFDRFAYTLEEPTLVFRGERNIKPIFDTNIKSYISCTPDIDFAAFFSHEYHREELEKEGYILQIVLPIGTRIIYKKSENEIILERNKYKYTFKENLGRFYLQSSLAKINVISVNLELIK